jgi:hypothetical protein
VDLLPLRPLFADVMAALLLQLGYAALPPRRPDLVGIVLDEAGLIDGDHSLYADDDLQPWEPCLLTLRVSRTSRVQGEETQAPVAPAARPRSG